MIEETQTRPRRWARVALGLVALTTLSAGTGWGAAHLASPANAAPDLAKVRAALKLRLVKQALSGVSHAVFHKVRCSQSTGKPIARRSFVGWVFRCVARSPIQLESGATVRTTCAIIVRPL